MSAEGGIYADRRVRVCGCGRRPRSIDRSLFSAVMRSCSLSYSPEQKDSLKSSFYCDRVDYTFGKCCKITSSYVLSSGPTCCVTLMDDSVEVYGI